MESVDDLPDYKTMREGYLMRQAQSERDRETLLAEARSDAERIIAVLIRDFRPARVYQWGSLVHSGHFSERSDIDIAVEGIMDPGTFFRMLNAASAMCLVIDELHKFAQEFTSGELASRGKYRFAALAVASSCVFGISTDTISN